MVERQYRWLTRAAVALVVAWIGWSVYDAGLIELDPAAYELDAARKNLEDGRYDEALAQYQIAFEANPENLGALRGMAQALMQLGAKSEPTAGTEQQRTALQAAQALAYYNRAMNYYDEAIAREEAQQANPLKQRILGVTYANRGILRDRMGDYSGALDDYKKSLSLEPEVAQGPGFLVRFMRNQAEKPPTIEDRARYLRAELSKPADEQILRVPELDARQRAYSMD